MAPPDVLVRQARQRPQLSVRHYEAAVWTEEVVGHEPGVVRDEYALGGVLRYYGPDGVLRHPVVEHVVEIVEVDQRVAIPASDRPGIEAAGDHGAPGD